MYCSVCERKCFDHERCTKLECTEPIRIRQQKRKRKAARRRARAASEHKCFHGPAPEWLSFVGPETGTTEKVNSGFHRLFNRRRGIQFTPLKSLELSEMA